MAITLQDKLVVAISSRALFDFEEENRLFEGGNDRAYMNLQLDRLDVPAAGGVAMPLVKKLLSFNADTRHRVEVVLLSRNDPTSGMRAFRSAQAPPVADRARCLHPRARTLRLPALAGRAPVPVGQRGRRPGSADRRLPGGACLPRIAAPGGIAPERSSDRLRRGCGAVLGRGGADIRGTGTDGVPGLRGHARGHTPLPPGPSSRCWRRCTS